MLAHVYYGRRDSSEKELSNRSPKSGVIWRIGLIAVIACLNVERAGSRQYRSTMVHPSSSR